jgi:hypothetical protein
MTAMNRHVDALADGGNLFATHLTNRLAGSRGLGDVCQMWLSVCHAPPGRCCVPVSRARHPARATETT